MSTVGLRSSTVEFIIFPIVWKLPYIFTGKLLNLLNLTVIILKNAPGMGFESFVLLSEAPKAPEFYQASTTYSGSRRSP
jgi:hypothetical protein